MKKKTTKKKTTRTSSFGAAIKKAPKKTLKKTAAKKPAVQAKKATAKRSENTVMTRASARRAPAKAKKNDLFTGATEVAITDNKIIVTREKSKNVKGKFEKREVREYHDKTPANMNALNRKLSSDPMKKVSVKFK